MKGLAIVVIILGLIAFVAAGAVLFMIYSPSVKVSPEMVLTGTVWGIAVLGLAVASLGVVVLRKST